jgi:hypothetical protein
MEIVLWTASLILRPSLMGKYMRMMYYVRVVVPESGISEIVPVDYATRLCSELSEAIRVFDAFNGTETSIRRSTWKQIATSR